MPEVIMPKMGDSMEEGKLLQWIKPDGTDVKAGEVIAEIETDKSNIEIEAEDAGVLRTRIKPGDTVPVGVVIATIGEPEPHPSPLLGKERESASAAPSRGESVHDAAAPRVVSNGGEKSAPPPRVTTAMAGNDNERVKASPLARRVAREQGVDIAQITGTGPSGRIVEADVTLFLKVRPDRQTARPVAVASDVFAPAPSPIELTAIRKVIAKRMTESKTTIPHFYVTADVDMTEAMALREKLNTYDETLHKISVNDLVVKAAAKAIQKVPAVNVAFRDDKIHPGSGIHVGIAVALEDGLIVPVVRNADQVPLRTLAQTSKELAKRARDKKLQPNEYSGGTFTVSNLGGYDVENFIAIIDPSQGAILAVSSIVRKPVVLDDGETIAVRQRMNVTFSGDHRVMDGAVGARFMQELKRLLQNPLSLLE